MGKVLWTEDGEQFDAKTHPGCMSGIFHALDYQYWHSNVKKMFPHKKHEVLIKRAKRNGRHKRISHDQDPMEVLRLLDAKTSHILVDQSDRKTSSRQKGSLKARIKSLVSEDTFKDKERGQGFVPSPRLQRTYSIHHLENSEWVHPIIFFPENVNSEGLSENVTDSPLSSKEPIDVTNPETKDSGDVLEIFKVNKEIFVNTLQDGSRASETKAKLTKSGSFPAAYKSGSRNLRPTKLKHKLSEFYSVSKKEKWLDSPAQKLASSDSWSLMGELDKRGEKNSDDYLNQNNVVRMRRVSSLNESAYRYAQLVDFCDGAEATLRPSRSLKLTNRNENSRTQEPSFFRRIHSLPHLDDPIQESRDTFLRSADQNESNAFSLALHSDKCTGSNSTEDCQCSNGMIDKSDIISKNKHSICPSVFPADVGKAKSPALGEDIHGLEESNHQSSKEISTHISSVLVPECGSQEEEKSQTKLHISEGLESLSNSEENLEKEIKKVKSDKRMESSARHYQDDDDLTYVKQILERSGFIKHGFQQKWYSSNQPLDPFVFQEIESQYFHDPEHFAEELNELSHRLLIFDLVDEVLLTMYERSSTYYPKALSSSCHIRPAPTGPLVLDSVWKSVGQSLNLKPDMNHLDSIASQDLKTDDGWMNLQLDSECVALDLEDLILDEILEDLLFERG